MGVEVELTRGDILEWKGDGIIISCWEGEDGKGVLSREDGGIQLDRKLGGMISSTILEEGFGGKIGSAKVISTLGHPKKIILIGAGKREKFKTDTVRCIGAKAKEVANEIKLKDIALLFPQGNIKGFSARERLAALVEGLVLGGYSFMRYKKEQDKETLKKVYIFSSGREALEREIVLASIETAKAVLYARDLVNTPAIDMTPEVLAKEAEAIAEKSHLWCKILTEEEIKKEGMNLILAVSKGSKNPPRLIHLKYRPKKTKKRIVLVGKGVTFDTGGYNLKSTQNIEHMKSDMAGAAAVIAAMGSLSVTRPDVEVSGFIPAVENAIGGSAIKPGDVIRSRSGKTIEISNTDAEGRLILADAIDYAIQKERPDILIDIATLTGGVLYALGELYTAALGNSEGLITRLIRAGLEAGEPIWQLPLEEEYLDGFKEGIADLNNIGKTKAQTIGGALFLSEFVKGGVQWAHLDIAAAAWANEDRLYRKKGATGAGTALFIKFLLGF